MLRCGQMRSDASKYLLTNSQADEMIAEALQAIGNIRPSAAGCSRRSVASRRRCGNRTRVARPAAQPLPDQKPAIL